MRQRSGGGRVGNDWVDPGYFPQRMEIEVVRVYDCGEGRQFFAAGNGAGGRASFGW